MDSMTEISEVSTKRLLELADYNAEIIEELKIRLLASDDLNEVLQETIDEMCDD